MKKTIIVMLALFLALPAISFAGSATSRWDMTIGGYVKFDMGYNTQGQGPDIVMAQKDGVGAYQSINNYGSFYTYAGETRLNFLVRGPDAWGAKTSAFVEGHFRGNESGTGSGTFLLRHAFMQFDWPSSKLLIGQTWQKWGILPTFANTLLDYNNLGPFLKGMRQPLIRFEQTIAKNWTWALGLISPTNTLGSGTGTGVDSYTRSQMPFWEGSFGFTSDKCGKIGPWQMMFALEGFYGRQTQIAGLNAATYAGNSGVYNVAFQTKDVDAWGISFKGFVPIIPEKKGSKKGAFSVSGVLFYTQNPGMFGSPAYGPAAFNGNYSYGSSGNTYLVGQNNVAVLSANDLAMLQYSSPVQYGGWGQASYFFTDKLFANAWYGYVRNQVSNGWMTAAVNADAMVNTTQIIGNIMYDVNAAIRFGFEYAYYNTRYGNYTFSGGQAVGQKDGSAQSFRVGAYYFF